MTSPNDHFRGRVLALEKLPLEQRSQRAVQTISVAVLLLVAAAVVSFIRQPALEWHVVWEHIFTDAVLLGLKTTILMTIYAMTIALLLGVIIANMRLSSNAIFQFTSAAFVWFFRSVPLLVLIILWYNFAIIYPQIKLGVPFAQTFWTQDTATLIDGFWAAVLAFGLHQAAYTSEVIRAAILAVPKGQREAASAMGMPRGKIFYKIILPQALKIAIPPIGNDTINLFKATAMAAFVAVPELLYSVQVVYQRTYQVVPLLIVATLWYTVVVSILTVGQHYLERHLSGAQRKQPRSKIVGTGKVSKHVDVPEVV